MTPFLSIYTPTHGRPKGLATVMQSVGAQTIASEIQHVIAADYAGVGIVEALYEWSARYAASLVGDYVTLLADDDVLAGVDVVARVKAFAESEGQPDVIAVQVVKGGLQLPACDLNPPVLGRVDLGCFIVRRDVWLAHLHDYGTRYEGDFDHAYALWQAGRRFAFCPMLFAIGGASKGAVEVAA